MPAASVDLTDTPNVQPAGHIDMEPESTAQPVFQVTHDSEPSESVVAGFSSFGLAGLTAVDYLTEQLELAETGHITSEELPAITPFENGTPRHHTRLYSGPESNVTALVNELFVPVWAADSFSGAVLDWADRNGVEEITILAGVPGPHAPDAHRTFYVATDDYRAARLEDTDVPPIGTGFLDGVNAGLVGQGIDSDLRVGMLVTPVHEQVPDIEAALRLLETVEDVLGLDVDTSALEQFGTEIEEYYRGLESRLQHEAPEEGWDDRMYM
jgi:uncharacterized protein